MESLIGKGRKPKFEVHIKIYDLNNVPLVSGSSYIKWHLSHSMHAEHRGRTSKCPIANHRVDYGFSKRIQHIRISVDKHNNLSECPIEFEVVQEFGITEKITLGLIKLNLSEYVEESEALIRDTEKRRPGSAGVSPTNVKASAATNGDDDDVPEGVVRRYLMQESKINSTLKMSILMVQIDGDRNFICPPLKSAPTFGGIAGIVASEAQAEEDSNGPVPNISKYPRDTAEIQDLYRRTLAASWSRLPNELPADECIEDIFAGGNGWKTHTESSTTDTEEEDGAGYGTLRPSDLKRISHNHRHHHHGGHHNRSNHHRTSSATSDKSATTVTGRGGAGLGKAARRARDDNKESDTSLNALAGDEARINTSGVRKEVGESEIRDDLIAWRLRA